MANVRDQRGGVKEEALVHDSLREPFYARPGSARFEKCGFSNVSPRRTVVRERSYNHDVRDWRRVSVKRRLLCCLPAVLQHIKCYYGTDSQLSRRRANQYQLKIVTEMIRFGIDVSR